MQDFTNIPPERVIYRGPHFFAVRDAHPVSPGHTLIISNELRSNYFALTAEERDGLDGAIMAAKGLIEIDFTPDGYNIGMNCGEAAGQTVTHFHCHLIPRYRGDMEDPRGGVRHCVAGKGLPV